MKQVADRCGAELVNPTPVVAVADRDVLITQHAERVTHACEFRDDLISSQRRAKAICAHCEAECVCCGDQACCFTLDSAVGSLKARDLGGQHLPQPLPCGQQSDVLHEQAFGSLECFVRVHAEWDALLAHPFTQRRSQEGFELRFHHTGGAHEQRW